MKVFKFGGASVNTVERIQNLARILQPYSGEKIMVIISAMGKTTNALEKVAEAFFAGKKEDALQLFEQVKQQHLTTAKYLLVTKYLSCEKQLIDSNQAAAVMGITLDNLYMWLSRNPEYRPRKSFGGAFMWSQEEIERAVERRSRLRPRRKVKV